jgi:hypothetical protein
MPGRKGVVPLQLLNAKRRNYKRPIAEQLPSVSVNDLPIPAPNDFKNYSLPNVSLRYPFLSGVKLSVCVVEFQLPSLHRGQIGPAQSFRLKPIRTGFGIRHAFVCACSRPVIKLYYLHRKLACRRCQDSIYASQALDQRSRPILQASRIESFLDNKSGLYQRTRERLKKKFGEKVMMAQGSMGTKARSLWK